MTLHHTSSAPKHVICRLLRSPLPLFSIVLLYLIYMFAFREGASLLSRGSNTLKSNMSLRGTAERDSQEEDTDGSLDERLSEDAQWEPDPEWTSAQRSVVKGGVEIYPVQPGRRPRQAFVPVVPREENIEGVFTTYVLPDAYDERQGDALKGLYVMFHGCHHGPRDWFDLPEERAIVKHLYDRDYAIVAPSSRNKATGCWNVAKGGPDMTAVRKMLWKFYRDWSIPPETPLFLFGASSGGVMATALGNDGGFQLCEKRTTYIEVAGIISQVSWGIDPGRFGGGLSPIAFMPMEKGEDNSPMRRNAPPVFGTSANVPPHIVAIAHAVRKKGGKPRMLHLPLGEIALYDNFFSDRVYELSEDDSIRLYSALRAARVLDCSPEEGRDCRLKADPRTHSLALDTLMSTFEMSLIRFGEDEDHVRMSTVHAKRVFEELLNVAWGAHELSAEFVSIWEPWLWSSCGDRCFYWYSNTPPIVE